MEKTLDPPSSLSKRSKSTTVTSRAAEFSRRTKPRLSDDVTAASEREIEVEDEEEEGVEEKIEALQTIVPGATERGVDALFEETATYILALQYQINAIKVLTAYLQRFEKDDDDMKFGG